MILHDLRKLLSHLLSVFIVLTWFIPIFKKCVYFLSVGHTALHVLVSSLTRDQTQASCTRSPILTTGLPGKTLVYSFLTH